MVISNRLLGLCYAGLALPADFCELCRRGSTLLAPATRLGNCVPFCLIGSRLTVGWVLLNLGLPHCRAALPV